MAANTNATDPEFTDPNVGDPGVTILDAAVVDWLLSADPGVAWQAKRDLLDAPPDEVAAERARVAVEGWGRRLLDAQADDGYWGGLVYGPHRERNTVMWTMQTLWRLGIDPADPAVRRAVERVRDGVAWTEEEGGRPFFSGEIEECANGGVLAQASYFGMLDAGAADLVPRLVGQVRGDGGWNCEPDSDRSSFDSTLCVLEGIWGYQAATGDADPALDAARRSGEEVLLERNLYRRLSTGEVVKERYLNFGMPTYWFYDVLRALDGFRSAGRAPDPRIAPALDVLLAQRGDDGRWPAGRRWAGTERYEIDAPPGEPSPWNTLRALRVLRWAAPVLDAAAA
ncbi:hypothetical protein ACDF64_08790 [Agromyces sp. MMS24-JH15]|uniref:hypothetical protein n=1 Tax=Agromyces sp. MMS24-JH15 TaxID=3243765 RepID=UPI00374A20FF